MSDIFKIGNLCQIFQQATHTASGFKTLLFFFVFLLFFLKQLGAAVGWNA